MAKVFLTAKVINNETYILVDDLVAALRRRADEYVDQAAKYDPQCPRELHTQYAYQCVAKELYERADILAFGAIAYNTEKEN